MSKRAVIYARVSGDDRGNDGRNLAGQLDMGRKYAEEHGYTVMAELPEDDRGASGATFELPMLSKALAMARAGQYDVLVVRELDRFARRLSKQLIVEEELKRAGVTIEYVLGEYPDTPEGNLMKNVRATVAEYEREKVRERIMRGQRLKVKSGSVLILGGQAPYGYTVTERDKKWAFEICESEARIVRLIFDWYTIGDETGKPLTIGEIARRLDAMGVPSFADLRPNNRPKKRGRGQWARSSVVNILKNETYAGVWHFGKLVQNGKTRRRTTDEERIRVEVPAIVSRVTWDIAHQRLEQNRIDPDRKTKHNYLLRRRAVCQCGLKMGCRGYRNTWGKKGGYVLYYCCPTNSKNLVVRDCDAPHFRADHIDAAVWEWVKGVLLSPENIVKSYEAYLAEQDSANAPYRERLEVVDALLVDNRAQLERLIDLYISGSVAKELLTERKARLEGTIDALNNERERLVEQLTRHRLTDEQIQTLTDYASKIRDKMPGAEKDFGVRRAIIDLLDVRATLTVEGSQKVIYVRCKIGETNFVLPTTELSSLFCLRPEKSGRPQTCFLRQWSG